MPARGMKVVEAASLGCFLCQSLIASLHLDVVRDLKRSLKTLQKASHWASVAAGGVNSLFDTQSLMSTRDSRTTPASWIMFAVVPTRDTAYDAGTGGGEFLWGAAAFSTSWDHSCRRAEAGLKGDLRGWAGTDSSAG